MQQALRRGRRVTPALSDHGIAVCSLALLIAWVACMCFARPFHLPDEGRYAAVAWEMLGSPNWLVPRIDGLPYFEKPPLYYWLAACAMGVFGANEFAARVPALIGAAIAGMALFDLCSRWSGQARARWIVVAWFSTPLTFLAMQFANIDMLVAGFITWSTCSFADAILRVRAAEPSRAPLLAAYAAAALGVLAKGLIGVVLPASIVVSWLVWQRRACELKGLLRWPGIALFAAIALPWFIAMQAAFPGFSHFFFVVQHLQRFIAHGFNNSQPFWFYPLVLAGFCLPWLAWLRPVCRAGRAPRPAEGAGGMDDPLRALMIAWAVAVLVFFSIPESKLIGYIIPATPPIAYFVGSALAEASRQAQSRTMGWAVASVAAAVAASTCVVAGFAPYDRKTDRPIGQYLAKHRKAAEPIMMIEEYRFDIPFYARTRDPALYVADWSGADVTAQDNVRREIYNAGRFASDSGGSLLVDAKQFQRHLCSAPISWVVASANASRHYPPLDAVPVAREWNGVRLWRVDSTDPSTRRRLDCPKAS
jgi:4-amino-4-deoxy-L-arabinose transferase-like glycosyltransferase